jgi:hypothetical protein
MMSEVWRPIETAPDDKDRRRYVVTDGRYLKKVMWSEKMGWYESIEGFGPRSIAPQPTHWLPDGEPPSRV